jgi:hypothetical protein
MRTNPPISLLAGLIVVVSAGGGCSNSSDNAGGSGGARGGSGGIEAGSGGMSTVPDSGGGLGSGGANDASAEDSGGMGSGGADASSFVGDASPEVAAGGEDASSPVSDSGPDVATGDGGMSSACPANPMRTDPPLTPAAFCAALLTPCKPHTQPPYQANCEAAYMNAKSQSCQTYNLCFGVVGMKMLIPYCSRAQGLGPAGNCS